MGSKTLADIPLWQVHRVQQKAVLRMHLYMTGETHRMLLSLGKKMKGAVIGEARGDSTIDGMGLYRAKQVIERQWRKFFDEWKALFEEMRTQAACLPFGMMAVYHEKFFKPAFTRAEKQLSERINVVDFVFNPQVDAVRAAANRRVYKDGLNLSRRVWQLDYESLREIENIINTGAINGASAWDIAEALEQYLGAGQNCPRWTRTRLYKISKKEIAAGRRTGLYSKDACAGQGVAYKALRLARNEIQAIHHMATDAVLQQMPWVQREQIHLSGAHPVEDECDTVVTGGENGKGVYAVGTITLPIHVQCLCYKTAVLMDEKEFGESLRGWMNGTQAWPEMDTFQQSIGGNVLIDLTKAQIAQHLARWAFEDLYKFT
jgi:hypothetical protein